MRKKEAFVHMRMLCRHWSLKWEIRRGAPLLKRLHLEPWTASVSGRVVSDAERRMKLEVSHEVFFSLQRFKQALVFIPA